MSSHLTAEVVGARQAEIAASTAHAHHMHDLRIANGRTGRKPASRIRRGAAIAVGLCLAASGTGVATASAGKSQHLSASQLQHRIRQLEAEGFVQTSCQVGSTRLYSARENSYVTVNW